MKNERTIWRGELTTTRKLIRRGRLFLSPGFLWICFFLALPCLALVAVSFCQRGAYGGIEWAFTWENYTRLAGFGGLLGWTGDYIAILWRSIVTAAVTTAFCVLLSYPVAFFIASRKGSARYLWLTLLIIPFWTNLVIRTYAWFLVLAPEMPPAKLAAWLGLIGPGEALYPSTFAVYIGMVSTFLPFMALPLYSSVEAMDWSLVQAARDLYSRPLRVFRCAILPQTYPGLSIGIVLTFIPCLGMFVVPDMLGGAKFMLMGNLIQQQFGVSRDWPFGAAISLFLMVFTLVALVLIRKKGLKHL